MPINKVAGSKDGKQKYRVRVNYTDIFGKPRQVERTVYGIAEAKEFEKKLRDDVVQAAHGRRMTLRELYDEYTTAKAHEVRESSLGKTKSVLENHVLPPLGDTPLDKLNVAVLQKWKTEMSEKPARGGGKLSLTTKQNAYGEFRALLNFAVKLEYLPKNPLQKVGNFKETIQIKKEMDFYTPEEFKKYIAAAREYAEKSDTLTDWSYYVFFCIAFFTGLRKGEIYALKWSDIDGDVVSVTRSIAQKMHGGDRETAPKNQSSVRTLQLPAPLIKVLSEHKARCSMLPDFNDDFRVCGCYRPLRDSSINNRNKRYAAAAGVKRIRIHDFRHSHASLLANNGINIQEIARRLGHSKVEITWNTYAHLYPREEERAVTVLNMVDLATDVPQTAAS